ncbi:MAG: hypothetical protein ACKN9E_08385 [Microcystaceae cyanobacterium]|nr:hypothetical protein [Merismopediaceae bacterium]
MMDENAVPTETIALSEAAFEDLMKERRAQSRILAFCQVYDCDQQFIGVSFDLTSEGACLSLPNTWTKEPRFTVILKRADSHDQSICPDVAVTIETVWRRERNELFDEIGGRIVATESPEKLEAFLRYCQTQGPSGLFDESDN